MRKLHAAFHLTAVACAGMPSLGAQSVRGVTVDGSQRPVAGVIIQLLDSANALASRALTNEQGEFRVAARIAGKYHLRASRIGYRPTVSSVFALRAGEEHAERLQLTGVQLALDTVRVVSSNSCRAVSDAGSATFAVLEQARTALLATELTGGTRGLTATTLDYDRALDARGKRILHENVRFHASAVRQPWSTASPESLHARGYVVKDATDSITYFAPGLDMLGSDLFIADHCFELQRETNRLGISFEPTPERRNIAEIRGTIWLDVLSSHLQRLDYRYVNQPIEMDAPAGAELTFARLVNGGWAITQWRIRMPVLENRIKAQSLGGPAVHLAELREQGGELVAAVRGRDTLWSQPPRLLRGVVLDSATGRPVPNTRLQVVGVASGAVTDGNGRFELRGLLIGDYAIGVQTPSLDSVGATHEVVVAFRGDDKIEMRVPNGAQFLAQVCGDGAGPRQSGVYGKINGIGRAEIPRDSKVVVEWRDIGLRSEGGNAVVARELQSRTARPDSAGHYRVCGVASESDLLMRVETDSGVSEPASARLARGVHFARVDLSVDRSASAFGMLFGTVRRDSAQFPVEGADVAIAEIGRSVTTDSAGNYRFANIPPGEYHVTVRKIGLTAFDTTLTFARGQSMRHNVRLKKTQVLAPVVTRSTVLPREFEEHRAIGLGSFLTRADLEKAEGRMLGSVLTQLRGMRVIQAGAGNYAWVTSSRRPDCLKNMICPADTFFGVDLMHGQVTRCYAQVYLDKHLLNRGAPTPPFNANEFAIESIEAVEYFAGPSETPPEYAGLNSTCGVLVLHTRRSR